MREPTRAQAGTFFTVEAGEWLVVARSVFESLDDLRAADKTERELLATLLRPPKPDKSISSKSRESPGSGPSSLSDWRALYTLLACILAVYPTLHSLRRP